MLADDFKGSIDVGRQAIEMAKDLQLDEIRAQALITVGTARFKAGDEEGARDVERGTELALASNHLAAAARGYQNLSAVARDPVRELEFVSAAEDLWLRLGHVEGARYAYASRAGQLITLGRWDEALPLIDAFITECEAGRPHYHEAMLRRCRSWARFVRDDADGAIDDIERSLVVGRAGKDPQTLFECLGDAAYLYARLGRLEEAKTLARELVAANREVPHDTMGFLLAAELLGMEDEVRRTFAEDVVGVRREALMVAVAERRFLDAAEIATRQGSVDTAAILRVSAAEALLEERRTDEAGEQLEQALAFYRSVGGTRLIREIEAQLAAIHSTVS
jgi:tetratricopeptide (TPR) repeat protein